MGWDKSRAAMKWEPAIFQERAKHIDFDVLAKTARSMEWSAKHRYRNRAQEAVEVNGMGTSMRVSRIDDEWVEAVIRVREPVGFLGPLAILLGYVAFATALVIRGKFGENPGAAVTLSAVFVGAPLFILVHGYRWHRAEIGELRQIWNAAKSGTANSRATS
jgi:hypothetical protein